MFLHSRIWVISRQGEAVFKYRGSKRTRSENSTLCSIFKPFCLVKCIQRVNYAFSNLSKVLYSLYLSIFATFREKKILKAMPISLYDKCFCCAYFYFLFSGSYFVFSISKLLMLFFKLILTIKGIVLSFVLFNYMSRSKYG